MAQRQLEVAEAEVLLKTKTVGPLQGFRSKLGRTFAAILKLNAEFKVEFDFGNNNNNEKGEPIDFTGQQPIGKCPVCGLRIFETETQYVCEKLGLKTDGCTFRSGKTILQRKIERDQMVRLLETNKTDLLKGFISKRGRPFSAFLVLDKKTGKVSFEFAPRAPKKPAKGKKIG